MSNLSNEDRARLMASKAQHEKELAEVKEAKRIAAEKEQFESFQLGMHGQTFLCAKRQEKFSARGANTNHRRKANGAAF